MRKPHEVYDTPLHHQPVLAVRRLAPLPVPKRCNRHVCLPVHSDMREDETQVLTAVAAAGELHGRLIGTAMGAAKWGSRHGRVRLHRIPCS